MAGIDVFRSLPRVGMATLTMVRSRTVMIVPRMTTVASTRVSWVRPSPRSPAMAVLVAVLLSVIMSSQDVSWVCSKHRVELNLGQLYFWDDGPMGLRELKKEQTRQLIADTAWRLFADRGFDRVSVAEIARKAQVAEATVFNYFPSKEDLFYWRLEAFGTQLADAISTRPPGEPVLAAFRRYLLAEGGLLAQVETGDPGALARLRTVTCMIGASPALLAREQQALTRNADALAALLAAETGAPGGELADGSPPRTDRLRAPPCPGRRGACPARRRRPQAHHRGFRAAGTRPGQLRRQATCPSPHPQTRTQPTARLNRKACRTPPAVPATKRSAAGSAQWWR